MISLGPLDHADDRPPRAQIAAALREAIDLGRLSPGDRLPSESELTQHYGVARTTVRQAIHELRTEGLVTPDSEHGHGVFVRGTPVVGRPAAGYATGVDSVRVGESAAPAGAAERLQIATRAPVVVRARRYLADGEPVEIATSYIPIDVARGTALVEDDSGPGGIRARLEEVGHPVERFVEEIAARMPTPGERRALRLPPRAPVLTVIRTAFDTSGTPVEVCDTVKAAYAHVLQYDFPAR